MRDCLSAEAQMARILLVDDSRLSRCMEGDALRAAGHEVTDAVNGAQGYELLQSGDFDLIVSDLLMPVCDGVEMLKKIRAVGNPTKIIICSADIQESTQRVCNELGISGFLNKPVKITQLVECVDKTLATIEEAIT